MIEMVDELKIEPIWFMIIIISSVLVGFILGLEVPKQNSEPYVAVCVWSGAVPEVTQSFYDDVGKAGVSLADNCVGNNGTGFIVKR
jgi:ABC-type glucose/galactose transport system permease subunit